MRRRRPDPYDPYYYEQYGAPRSRFRRNYPPGYGYRQPGGSCLRDACLLETGCCIAEGLDGNCLLLLVPAAPALLSALVGSGVRSTPRLVSAIRVYQREVSARRPAVCRFAPSCSAYAELALTRHGTVRGSLLTVRRLLRCRPGGRHGADPVPPA